MTKLRVTASALMELEQAVDWYEARSPDAAARFCRAIDLALDEIAAHPRRFAMRDERRRYLLLQRFPYHIIDRIDGTVVTVGAIRHTSRDDVPLED